MSGGTSLTGRLLHPGGLRVPAQPPPPPQPLLVVPQVVAHRGASFDEPEHTLAAYQRAIEAGADAVECDIRMTADGHLVCVHDRRIDRTSNATGSVSSLELAQLEGLDWASWKLAQGQGDAVEMPDRDRSRLLTLRRLLSVVADADRPVEVAIETKHPTRHAGHVERQLVELLDYFGWRTPQGRLWSRVRVMSFSSTALRRLRRLAPRLPLVLLMHQAPVRLRTREGRLPPSVAAAGISVSMLQRDPWYVERLHEAGHDVHVWTVDEPDDVNRCLAAGVEAIITNRPDAVLEQLRRLRQPGGAGGDGPPTQHGGDDPPGPHRG
ncbi:MAG: glycerophosphodiester phosphodiesterase family protein [Actinomycetes bacterium]